MKVPFPSFALLTREHWQALGVLCAGLLLAEVNVLSSRHYLRIDASAGQRYTLSEPTRELLAHLQQPVDVFVLLGTEDPLLDELRQLLVAYESISPELRVKYIDPDRDVAEFLALGSEHDLGTKSGPEGETIADTAVFLRSGARSWFIRRSQLSEFDGEGRLRLRLEARITESLAQVQDSKELSLCFVTGHGELSIDDTSEDGLLELRRRLERGNVRVERVPLDVPEPDEEIRSCDAIAVVGPERPWPTSHTEALVRAFRGGAQIALFLDPIVDAEGLITKSGLGALLETLGVDETPHFILERSPEHRLPTGMGEIFFAQTKTHPITRGLSSDETRTDARVVATFAQPLGRTPKSSTLALLETSPNAVAIDNLKSLEDEGESGRPLTLAYAGSLATSDGKVQRWAVMGTSNVLSNASFRDPALFGNQVLAENSFSWLLERPQLVSVPERAPLSAGLNLTEESLGELLRYVLIYMPLSAACTGALVLYRRRRSADGSHPGGEARES